MQTKPKRTTNIKFRWDILLLLVLAVAIIVLLVVMRPMKQEEQKKEYPKQLLAIDGFTSIDVRTDKYTYTISKKDNALYIGNRILNKDKIRIIDDLIKSISVEESVADKEKKMDEYGLESPHMILTIHSEDKTTHRLCFGNIVPLSRLYYFTLDNGSVYAINGGYEDIFNMDPRLLVDSEDIGIYRELIKSIRIVKSNSNVAISLDYNKGKGAYGYISSPISYPVDRYTLNSIIEQILSLDLSLPVASYNGETKYGFNTTNSTHLYVEQYAGEGKNISVKEGTKELVFGNSIDDFYTYVLYNGNVYRMSSIAIHSIINVNLDSLYSKKVFNLTSNHLDKLDLIRDNVGSNTIIWSIIHANDGSIKILRNNKDFSTDAFVSSIKKLMDIELDGYQMNINLSKQSKIRSIEISMMDKSTLVDFYYKDEYNVYVSIDGVSIGYMLSDKLNSILYIEGK